MDTIKKIFGDEKKSSHKSEVHTSAKVETTTKQPQIATASGAAKCEFAADNLAQDAQRLKQEACRKLEASDTTLMAAKAAQEEVERAAARANIVTNQALRQEVEGQKTLVEAGHKLMEAGAKLQEEAAQVGQAKSAEINIVQKGQIQQNTSVEVPNVPASELHVLQNRVVGECRPMAATAVHTETIGGVQGGYAAGAGVYKKEEHHTSRMTESH